MNEAGTIVSLAWVVVAAGTIAQLGWFAREWLKTWKARNDFRAEFEAYRLATDAVIEPLRDIDLRFGNLLTNHEALTQRATEKLATHDKAIAHLATQIEASAGELKTYVTAAVQQKSAFGMQKKLGM